MANSHPLPIRVVSLALLAVLALALLVPGGAAQAQAGIDRVEPSTVSSTATTTLVVYGGGFTAGAVVVVGGAGALQTSFVSPSVLTAVLPAGAPIGTFDVTVVLSTTSLTKPGALTVVGPTATPQPTVYVRPLLVVQSYGASSASLTPGSDVDFEMTLVNSGQGTATNVVTTFTAGDLIPRVTGGVRSVGTLTAGATARLFQPLSVSGGLARGSVATLQVAVSYTDEAGQAYHESFTLTFPVAPPPAPGPTRTPTPTPTARALVRPQLLISAYRAGVEPLQPGSHFTLQLDVQNLGAADARRVTMIAGGGTAASAPPASGTPDGREGGGGVQGSGGDFTNFAPLGASNIQSLSDLAAGASLTAQQTFVVNATTKAGAYPMKFSFVYVDASGVAYTDDQVITLLVYQLPQLDVNFYREVGPLMAAQPNPLPLQVVNLGRSSAVLGNMRVTAEGGQLSNNVILVGALEPGGYFPLDAMLIPAAPGPLDLVITIDYTDDFNQSQRITHTLTVDVMEAPPMENGGGMDPGYVPPPTPAETVWQKFLRFVRGLFGLDSAQPAPAVPGSEFPVPGDGGAPPVEITAVPVPMKGP